MTPDEIRAARKQLGLSQKVFAAKLGVSYTSVNRWERGHAVPQPDRLTRLDGLIAALRDGKVLRDLRSARRSNTSRRGWRFSNAVTLDAAAALTLAEKLVPLMAALDGLQPGIRIRVSAKNPIGCEGLSMANAILNTVKQGWAL